jgi:hypothetical protein
MTMSLATSLKKLYCLNLYVFHSLRSPFQGLYDITTGVMALWEEFMTWYIEHRAVKLLLHIGLSGRKQLEAGYVQYLHFIFLRVSGT